jgi:CubicO group peptidase (beta-lactamase class C family)
MKPVTDPKIPRAALAMLVPIALLALGGPAMGQALYSATGVDADAYGQAAGYPVASRRADINTQTYMVGSYSHFDALFPTHEVAKSATPSVWQRSSTPLTVNYTYQNGHYGLQDYLAHNPATGLLIARGDTILFEQYQYGRTDRDRFLSQSMAKTILAMLVGIAVSEHAIHSIDDPAAAYVPELAGTELGQTPIRALLHMASGIAFTEVYDGHDDNATLGRALFTQGGPGPAAVMAQFNTRVAPPDILFHYAGVNPELLGLVLARATGQTLAAYLQSRIWQPMGAEADAKWVVDVTGQEIGYASFNATLRDYARFGRLLAAGGAMDGRQIIPSDWVRDATAWPPLDSGLRRTGPAPWGYGYLTWLMPGSHHAFALQGIHGQHVFVDPVSKLVLVHTAVRVPPSHNSGDAELLARWRALTEEGRN